MLTDIYKELSQLEDGVYAVKKKWWLFSYVAGYVTITRQKDGTIQFMTTSDKDTHYRPSDFKCFSIFIKPETLEEVIFSYHILYRFWHVRQSDDADELIQTFISMLSNKTLVKVS